MTDEKLDPRSLTAEERTIVDRIAANCADSVPSWEAAYERAVELAEPAIFARRRARFAAPEKEEPVLKVCPNCGDLTAEPHWIDPEGGHRKWYCTRPEPAQKAECPNCKRPVEHEREHTIYMRNAYICERYEPAQPEPAAPSDSVVDCKHERGSMGGQCVHCHRFTDSEPEPAANGKTRGLYNKFAVARTDGKSAPGEKHDGCEYFVLDLTHDKYAPAALRAYAAACAVEYPKLSADLRGKFPEPAAPEMPLALQVAVEALEHQHKSGAAIGVRSWWRDHSRTVGITPALEKVLESAELAGKHYDDWSLLSAVAAVRMEYGRKP